MTTPVPRSEISPSLATTRHDQESQRDLGMKARTRTPTSSPLLGLRRISGLGTDGQCQIFPVDVYTVFVNTNFSQSIYSGATLGDSEAASNTSLADIADRGFS